MFRQTLQSALVMQSWTGHVPCPPRAFWGKQGRGRWRVGPLGAPRGSSSTRLRCHLVRTVFRVTWNGWAHRNDPEFLNLWSASASLHIPCTFCSGCWGHFLCLCPVLDTERTYHEPSSRWMRSYLKSVAFLKKTYSIISNTVESLG